MTKVVQDLGGSIIWVSGFEIEPLKHSDIVGTQTLGLWNAVVSRGRLVSCQCRIGATSRKSYAVLRTDSIDDPAHAKVKGA